MEIGKPIETIEVTDPGIEVERPAQEPNEVPAPQPTPAEPEKVPA